MVLMQTRRSYSTMFYLLTIQQRPPSCTEAAWVLVGGARIDSNECSYDRRSRHLSLRPDQNHTAEWCYDLHIQWISQILWRIQKQYKAVICQRAIECAVFSKVCGGILTILADKRQFCGTVSCGLPLEAWVSQYVSTSSSWLWAAHPVWKGQMWTIQPRERTRGSWKYSDLPSDDKDLDFSIW